MLIEKLNDGFKMKTIGDEKFLNASLPGSVYSDLLKNHKMEDPYYRDNELSALKLMHWNASLEIVAAAGKKIGIDITTYFPDANTFYDDLGNKNFDIAMYSPSAAGISNPWTRAYGLLSSSYNKIKTQTIGNFGGYANARVDKLLELIPHETDKAKLKANYTELSKIYLTEVPSFSLMYRPEVFYTVNETI